MAFDFKKITDYSIKEYLSLIVYFLVLIFVFAYFGFYNSHSVFFYSIVGTFFMFLYKRTQIYSLILLNVITLLVPIFIWPSAAVILIGLVLSVLFHEGGHLFYMKKFGVEVKEFAIGFGPKLFGFRWKEIDWNFRAFLMGGFVKPIDDDLDLKNKKEVEAHFPNMMLSKPYWQKFLIFIGGIKMNIVFMLTILMTLYGAIGIEVKEPVRDSINFQELKKQNALDPKLITYIEDSRNTYGITTSTIFSKEDLKEYLKDKNYEIVGTTVFTSISDPKKQISVANYKITAKSPLQALKMSYAEIRSNLSLTLNVVKGFDKTTINSISSPVGLVKVVGGEKGKLFSITFVVYMVALLNFSLAFMNILPIPPLDGGHVAKEGLFHLKEFVMEHYRRKKKSVKEIIDAIIAWQGYFKYIEYTIFILFNMLGVILIFRDLFFR